MRELCVMVFLGINSWMDMKKREVSLITAAAFGAIGAALRWSQNDFSLEILVSLGISGLFLGISVITQGAIGMGDVWLLLALAVLLDLREYLMALFGGFLLCALWAVVMLAIFRRNGRSEIPFVPFLFLGYVGGLLLW